MFFISLVINNRSNNLIQEGSDFVRIDFIDKVSEEILYNLN